MQTLDYTVLVLYLIGTVLIGVLLSAKNKSSADMFAAGGQSPWWVSGLSGYMTMFSAGTFVVWGGIAYERGAVAIAINLSFGIAALVVGYFLAARWKRLGVGTPAQYLELRFGRPVVNFYTAILMIYRVVGTAIALYALAAILVSLMPLEPGNPLRDTATGNLSLTWALLIFGCVVVLYTMLGGLWAVLMTDVLQFIVLTVAVLLILPLIWQDAGGWSAFVAESPAGFLSPVNGDYSITFLGGWILVHIFLIGADWAFAQRFISVPSAADARKSAYLFGGLYLLSPFLWMLPPMMYRTINPDADPEQAYILASQSVLPLGMIGLMTAAMFSATASMASSQLNVFAGVLTESLYKKWLNPAASEASQVVVGRLFTALLGGLIVAIALSVPYLGGAEKVIVALTSLLVGPLMAPSVWGMLGRKIDANAVWSTAGVCFAVGLLVKIGLAPDTILIEKLPQLRDLATWLEDRGKTVDILLGAALPVAVLGVMHCLARDDSEGARRVERFSAEAQGREQTLTMVLASETPAKIVSASLLVCALLFVVIAVIGDSAQAVMLVFAAGLAVLSAVIYCRAGAGRIPARRREPAAAL